MLLPLTLLDTHCILLVKCMGVPGSKHQGKDAVK
jgi:hypothetical protein